jgi:hypothetical protein
MLTLNSCYLYIQSEQVNFKETNLIPEELPAITEPFRLKSWPKFLQLYWIKLCKKADNGNEEIGNTNFKSARKKIQILSFYFLIWYC